MKALVFGINGQDGYYLNALLNQINIEVIGISRHNSNWVVGDVADRLFVERIIQSIKPEYIFHLAANSMTRHDVLFENHETISTGTLNILESVYKHSKYSKIFISGSALQFVNKSIPISENDQFEARDAYSVSRIQSVFAARYFRSLDLQIYIGYFFHHDSPQRSEKHLSMRIAKAVSRIKDGSKEILEIGNLMVAKEFNFAGDFMRAIWILMNQNSVFESVIGSGNAISIQEWIEICFNLIGKDWKEYIRIADNYKPDFQRLVSDPHTIFSLGWQPEMNIQMLAKEMIDN